MPPMGAPLRGASLPAPPFSRSPGSARARPSNAGRTGSPGLRRGPAPQPPTRLKTRGSAGTRAAIAGGRLKDPEAPPGPRAAIVGTAQRPRALRRDAPPSPVRGQGPGGSARSRAAVVGAGHRPWAQGLRRTRAATVDPGQRPQGSARSSAVIAGAAQGPGASAPAPPRPRAPNAGWAGCAAPPGGMCGPMIGVSTPTRPSAQERRSPACLRCRSRVCRLRQGGAGRRAGNAGSDTAAWTGFGRPGGGPGRTGGRPRQG
ncbi:hypothetical protein VR46_09800 [Streptomyces sp. NRRL S-444]|nr:hypothetical protein VR46_09800 [Streptomyces sp. NRRL S-444]